MSGEPPDIDIEPPPRPEPHLRVVALDQEGIAERIGSDPLTPGYRVVADLSRGAAAGYEVLVQIGDEAPLTPASWSRRGHPVQAGAVESRLVEVALASRRELPARRFLVIQISTVALLSDPLLAVFEAAGSLDGVVVAVSGDADPVDAVAARTALRGLRDRGARLAVDDTGGSYASLREIADLRPDLVRVGERLTTGIDHDPSRSAVVEAIIGLATRIGAEVIAADIASAAELREIRRLGAAMAEGPLLGRVAPAMEELGETARAAITLAAPDAPEGGEPTVAGVVEPVAPIPVGGTLELMADRFLEDPKHDFLAIVDADGRPVALADRAALLRGEAYEHEPLLVRPATTLRAVARRMAGRPAVDRAAPVVCCHGDGGYVGLVRVERVLDALGAES